MRQRCARTVHGTGGAPLEDGGGRVGRAAVGMGAVTAVSRGLGFVRVLVVAAVLGTTFLGNAFQAANSLSNVLFELLAAGALSAVLVPTFVRLLDAGDQRGRRARWRAACSASPWSCSGRSPSSASLAAPLIAELLTIGVPARRGRGPARADHVPAALVPSPGAAVRGGHGRHRGALRQAPVRRHRRGADRQHGGHGRRPARLPVGRRARPRARPVDRRAVPPRAGRHRRGDRVRRLPVAGVRRLRLPAPPPTAAGRPAGGRHAAPFGLGRRPPHRRRTAAGRGGGRRLGVEGGVVAYQVGFVFFLAPYGILAQPIHTAILPELVAEASDGEARARTSLRSPPRSVGRSNAWRCSSCPCRRA